MGTGRRVSGRKFPAPAAAPELLDSGTPRPRPRLGPSTRGVGSREPARLPADPRAADPRPQVAVEVAWEEGVGCTGMSRGKLIGVSRVWGATMVSSC